MGRGLLCQSTGDSTGGRAHRPGNAVFFLFNSNAVSLPVIETQKYRRNASGVDRCETGFFFFVTVWDPGLFDHCLGSLACGQRASRASVCAFSSNMSSWVCSIKYVDAAHHKVAQWRSEHVVLSPEVKPPIASTLFSLAGG